MDVGSLCSNVYDGVSTIAGIEVVVELDIPDKLYATNVIPTENAYAFNLFVPSRSDIDIVMPLTGSN
jgi:hypothetical protein